MFDLIVESVPPGMISDDDLTVHLLPASAMGYINIGDLEPERGMRIRAALHAGTERCMSQVDKDRPDLIEFHKGLLVAASGRIVGSSLGPSRPPLTSRPARPSALRTVTTPQVQARQQDGSMWRLLSVTQSG